MFSNSSSFLKHVQKLLQIHPISGIHKRRQNHNRNSFHYYLHERNQVRLLLHYKQGRIYINPTCSLFFSRFIPPIDFTDSNEPGHDVTLVIAGEKIYANKGVRFQQTSKVLTILFTDSRCTFSCLQSNVLRKFRRTKQEGN